MKQGTRKGSDTPMADGQANYCFFQFQLEMSSIRNECCVNGFSSFFFGLSCEDPPPSPRDGGIRTTGDDDDDGERSADDERGQMHRGWQCGNYMGGSRFLVLYSSCNLRVLVLHAE